MTSNISALHEITVKTKSFVIQTNCSGTGKIPKFEPAVFDGLAMIEVTIYFKGVFERFEEIIMVPEIESLLT